MRDKPGLYCGCGHELNFTVGEIEVLTMEIPMLLTCSLCQHQVHVKRVDDTLATFRVTGVKEAGGVVNFTFDTKPISVCNLPT